MEQQEKIIAKIEKVHISDDNTHKVLFSLDQEITAHLGQYIMISYEKENIVFKRRHILKNAYIQSQKIEENIDFQKLEDQSFLPLLKKDEVFIITGPYNLTRKERVLSFFMLVTNHKTLLVKFFAVLLIIGITAFFLIKNVSQQEKTSIPLVTKVFVPKKTDYNSVLPPGFLTTVPVEKDAILSQSYIKEYKDQTQMSIVLPSKKTVSENYVLYEKFLKDEGWKLTLGAQTSKSSSLYGIKENYKIDIMLLKKNATSTPAIKSYIVMNLLKK